MASFGFWPGTNGVCDAAFYAYAAPEPAGFARAKVAPAAAAYFEPLREFILPYEQVRRSAAPREDVLAFFQSVYEAASSGWDRRALDRPPWPVHAGLGGAAHPPVHPADG